MKWLLAFCLLSAGVYLNCNEKTMTSEIPSSSNQSLPIVRTETLLDENLQSTQALKDILTLTDLPPYQNYLELLHQTQERWFLKGERWNHQEQHQSLKEKMWPLLSEVGVLRKIEAQKNQYDYALVLGSTVLSVRNRVKYLVEEWNRGVRFNQLIFLCADWAHTSLPELERLKDLSDSNYPFNPLAYQIEGDPKTEYDFMQSVWKQTEIPELMKEVEVIFVKTPSIMTNEGKWRRAWTEDTLKEWLATYRPHPGKCLFFSTQPYVIAQDPIIRKVLPVSYQIETIGSAASPDLFISKHLDNLARAIFYEGQRKGVH